MVVGTGALGEGINLMADASFWRGKRVLLTGHTGFKGVWLNLWLARLGADVFGLSMAPECEPNLFGLVRGAAPVAADIGDVRDVARVAEAVAAADPAIVIHMAAQALVRRGYSAPAETFAINVMGTVNLLMALRGRANLRAVLVVTTDKVYRNLEDGRAFREDDSLGAHDPYSASKAAAEIAVQSLGLSFFAETGTPVLTARAGNVIGGGDWSEDRLVPDIWRAIQANRELVLRHPDATRPWQHAIEPLAGYLRFIEAAADGRSPPSALNFGPYPEDVLTVAQLAEALPVALGAKLRWRKADGPQFAEMRTLALDPSLAGRSIGWKPRLTSREAVAWTAEWYGRFAKGEEARALCEEQISRYEALP